MINTGSEALALAERYDTPVEDVLFINLHLQGIRISLPYLRVRFEFIPQEKTYFALSFQRGVRKYFFPLPVALNSPYHIENGSLIMNDEILGRVNSIDNDECDTSYPRRGGTVLNLNPNSQSSCCGCGFCYSNLRPPKDRDKLSNEQELRHFIEAWLENHRLHDLSRLIQIAVVTGCYESERKVLDFLRIVSKVTEEYSFDGELLYFGSEITTQRSIDELGKRIRNFAMCLTIECFENRERILRPLKAKITLQDAERLLTKARKAGFQTTFSYIIGLDSFGTMLRGFKELMPVISRFPIVNIFQTHIGLKNLRCRDAQDINFYLKARKELEKVFENTDMRPRPWENYRSLWFLNFGNEALTDIRMPL